MKLFLLFACCCMAVPVFADDLVFQDTFDVELSDRWEVVGLSEDDYRIRDGALEIRCQQQGWSKELPTVRYQLPGGFGPSMRCSVDVSVVGEFEQEGQFAGLFLVDDDGADFRATVKRLDRTLVFSPGLYTYRGAGPEHKNLDAYEITYPLASKDAGPLNIVVRDGDYAYFQVGPAKEGKYENGRYRNLFHSAIDKSGTNGFALAVGGGPKDSEVWVRFDNFRVTRSR